MACNFEILPNKDSIVPLGIILFMRTTGTKEIKVERGAQLLRTKAGAVIAREKEGTSLADVNVIDHLIGIIFKSNIVINLA